MGVRGRQRRRSQSRIRGRGLANVEHLRGLRPCIQIEVAKKRKDGRLRKTGTLEIISRDKRKCSGAERGTDTCCSLGPYRYTSRVESLVFISGLRRPPWSLILPHGRASRLDVVASPADVFEACAPPAISSLKTVSARRLASRSPKLRCRSATAAGARPEPMSRLDSVVYPSGCLPAPPCAKL